MIEDAGNTVSSAQARTYTASAYVKAANLSTAGEPATIKVREFSPSGSKMAECDVRVSTSNPLAGDAFYVDAITLH